jgi:quinol monooxygenase YgiN
MTVEWDATPQESASMAAALHALMVAARSEPGCVGCQISTQMGEKTRLRYVEEWRDEANLKQQLHSERFARLAEIMEHATGSPNVVFDLPSGRRDLSYAEEVRRPQGEAT